MGHPLVQNDTPFVFEPLYLMDEGCCPLLVVVVKGTFVLERGRCVVAGAQVPIMLAGEYFGPDPATSSFRYEPEVAFHKPATDVAVIGCAHAPDDNTREMLVEVRVGPLSKQMLVVGDRVWFDAAGLAAMTRPARFERMPLVYERAFGGSDRTDPDPTQHSVYHPNPVGVGYGHRGIWEGTQLPNVEDPRDRIRQPGDTPRPAGIGFTAPHWSPRVRLAGTYDERWEAERAPMLPVDFDRRHFNAASPGLVAAGYLKGDEDVSLTGMTAYGYSTFALPGEPAPEVHVRWHRQRETKVRLDLDTVIIEPDEQRLSMLWRGHLRLGAGPHEIAELWARRSKQS